MVKNGMDFDQSVEDDDMRVDFSKDENEARGNWSGRFDFLLASLGFAVGLGNVWRFPYLCYRNGGAVFFIPYCIFLVFVGMPVFVFELSLGQYTSKGPLKSWEMAPILKGVGAGMVICSAYLATYYNVIIAWSVYYLFASFTSDLPWGHCDRSWNTEWCDQLLNANVSEAECSLDPTLRNAEGVCWNLTDNRPITILNKTLAGIFNHSSQFAAEQYYYNQVLQRSDGIENFGGLDWPLPLCLLLSWTIVALSLIKGVKSSGKVVYFTALFPYVVLIILLIRGATLEGSSKGVDFYILNVDVDRLYDAQVWKDAAVQIFFSLSTGFGGLIALSSYNRFHNDALRDSIVVTLGNCLTSFFAGFTIFTSLGYMAHTLGRNVADVVDAGFGLAFVVYPTAITLMPVPTLWAILFFTMLITLGLDSEFALVETVTTCIMDQWPGTRQKKWAVVLTCCIIGFFLSLPMVAQGGYYLLNIMDSYSVGWNLLLFAGLECAGVSWIYGFWKFRKDIYTMIGNRGCGCFPWAFCWPWWMLNIAVITPVLIAFVMIYQWVDYKPLEYSKNNEYPIWANVIGWLMPLFSVVVMICTSIYVVCTQPEDSIGEKLRSSVRPSRYWGPDLVKHRRLVTHLSPFEVNPYGGDDAIRDKGHVNASYSF